MRRQAKIINFATIYGVSPFGLSQQADIGIKEAALFIQKYLDNYTGIREYIERTIAFAREHGYVQTMLGRRRPVPDIHADVSFRREGAERIAINTPIQGTSADLIKIAKMIIQVHDELVFEVPEREKDEIESLVRREMEGALALSVPVVVDMGWGAHWAEAH